MSELSFPPQSTPFPNRLLDAVMPTLRDTEWRLLCVIVRQTLGWQSRNRGQRKQSDWLTHSQLKARTGRSSEAVSHALEVLVRRNLVDVCNDVGEPLVTPQERRRCAGRLFFKVSARVLDAEQREESYPQEHQKSEIRKPKTTKETDNKKRDYHKKTLKPVFVRLHPVDNSVEKGRKQDRSADNTISTGGLHSSSRTNSAMSDL